MKKKHNPLAKFTKNGITRISAEELRKIPSMLNHKLLDATTDEMIARQIAEDPDTAPDVTNLPDSWRVKMPNIRSKLGMTQQELAKLLRISVATIRNWEQGRTPPDGAACTLLTILAREPKAVMRALHTD